MSVNHSNRAETVAFTFATPFNFSSGTADIWTGHWSLHTVSLLLVFSVNLLEWVYNVLGTLWTTTRKTVARFDNPVYTQLVFLQKLMESGLACFFLYSPNVSRPTSEIPKLTVYLQKKKLCFSSWNVILHPFTHLQYFKDISFSSAVFFFKIINFCFPSSHSNWREGRVHCLTQSLIGPVTDSTLHQFTVMASRAVSFQGMRISANWCEEINTSGRKLNKQYLQVFTSPFLCSESEVKVKLCF